MMPPYNNFIGYDLKKGCQIIAVISSVMSLLHLPILILGGLEGEPLLIHAQWTNPSVRRYGGSAAFWYVALHTALQEIVYIIICIILYIGVKRGSANCARIWVRASVIWLGFYALLVPYAAFLLFIADAPGSAVRAPFSLLFFFPVKLYFTLVVYSYYKTLVEGWLPDPVCVLLEKCVRGFPRPRVNASCTNNRPTDVVVP